MYTCVRYLSTHNFYRIGYVTESSRFMRDRHTGIEGNTSGWNVTGGNLKRDIFKDCVSFLPLKVHTHSIPRPLVRPLNGRFNLVNKNDVFSVVYRSKMISYGEYRPCASVKQVMFLSKKYCFFNII